MLTLAYTTALVSEAFLLPALGCLAITSVAGHELQDISSMQ